MLKKMIFLCLLGSFSKAEIIYTNNLHLHEDRKVGVGFGLGGVLGSAGLNIELNLKRDQAVLTGFGQGRDFGTFHLMWKQSLEGQYFTPYYSAGIAHWYNSRVRNISRTSHVLDAVLSDNIRHEGPFNVDFIVGSLGLQYNQLDGDWTGAGFYFEFNLMAALNNTAIVPNASVGTIYYF